MSPCRANPVLSRGWRTSLAGRLIVSIFVSLVSGSAVRAQNYLQEQLRGALSAVSQPGVLAGASAIDLESGEVVFAQAADVPLIPASCMKVFVMALSLRELGPGFTFDTILATDGRDLLVVGDGDPAFGDERIHAARGESITSDFERWAGVLVANGLYTIPGDLVIDESIFDDQWVHPSWDQDDLDNWYAAPVGALNLNDNCVDITIEPAPAFGEPVLVSVQPNAGILEIVNKCRSGGNGTPILHHPHDTFEYRISGSCTQRWRFVSVSVPDPGLVFADSLRRVLAERGVQVSGKIVRGRVRLPGGTLPSSLTVLSRRKTPLEDVLLRAGKDSQNLFAECLLKRAGYAWARRHGDSEPRGSWTTGRRGVLELMKQAGIDAQSMVIADGSGLSRDNRCTARQLVQLLAWMHGQPEGDLLRASLSVAGVDGSLRKRLKDTPGRVYAKTGTMSGVRALAGYVGGDNGPRYAFAVLFNGYKGSSTPYKEVQDRFCRVLAGAQR